MILFVDQGAGSDIGSRLWSWKVILVVNCGSGK